MTIERRSVIQGMAGAAIIAPLITTETVAAQTPAKPATMASDAGHMRTMHDVFGAGAMGAEVIAMLLYPGFTALDLVGPQYFLACMAGAKVHLVTTEKDLSPLVSDLGLAIAPTMRMADVPAKLDMLFIPGGTNGTMAIMQRADVMDWVRDRAARARYITSVCTGSMVLAHAGLLRGKRATSHWVSRDILSDYGAIAVDNRIVRDGNIITGAGVSAGLDFAIAMVATLRGPAYAQALMLQSEYAPEPPMAGGTMATTSAPVSAFMLQHFAPVQSQFKTLARVGGGT